MDHDITLATGGQPIRTFEQLAEARRIPRIASRLNLLAALPAEDRFQVRSITAAARVCIGAAIDDWVETLDALSGDADIEASGDELDFPVAGWTPGRHGCDTEDADDDDPRELVGDEGDYSDGDCGQCAHYGIDQTRPIAPGNPEVA